MPFNEPASLHDWQGGPPIIPSILSGKSSELSFRMSFYIKRTLGKFFLKVGHIFASYSFATTVLKPALWNPRSNPPAPVNKLIKFIYQFNVIRNKTLQGYLFWRIETMPCLILQFLATKYKEKSLIGLIRNLYETLMPQTHYTIQKQSQACYVSLKRWYISIGHLWNRISFIIVIVIART